jgi:hypothetical protein
MITENNNWHTKLLKELPLSPELQAHFAKQNYNTLDDVLQNKVSSLLNQQGFTYHILQELLEFLKTNNLENHLQE